MRAGFTHVLESVVRGESQVSVSEGGPVNREHPQTGERRGREISEHRKNACELGHSLSGGRREKDMSVCRKKEGEPGALTNYQVWMGKQISTVRDSD